MLGTIHLNDQLCRCTIKIYNKSADDSLFVNFRWVFAEEKIPQLAFMGRHFPAKPPGIFQLAIIFWYGHIYPLRPRFARPPLPKREASPSQSASPPALPKGEPRSTTPKRCIEVRTYNCLTYWYLLNSYFYIFKGNNHDNILVRRILQSNTDFEPCTLFYINEERLTIIQIGTLIGIFFFYLNRH